MFSAQQLLDCSRVSSYRLPNAALAPFVPIDTRQDSSLNAGCGVAGGTEWASAWYFKKATGQRLTTAAEYAWVGSDQACAYDITKSTYMWLRDVTYHVPATAAAINTLLETTTLATSVTACAAWSSFTGAGTFDDVTCTTGVASGVHIIGFDT